MMRSTIGRRRTLLAILLMVLGVASDGSQDRPTVDPEIVRARADSAAGRSRDAAVRLIRLGEQARREGDPVTGLARLEAAALLAPELGAAHASLGQAYVLADRHASAIPEFKRALDLGAPPGPITFLLAGAYWETGALDEAERNYRALIEPSNTPVRVHACASLGSLLVWRGKAEQALDPLRVAAAASPGDRAIAFDLARALEAAGKPENALERYLALADAAPESLGPQYRAARLLAKLGRTQESRSRMDAYRAAYARDQSAARERQTLRAELDRAWRLLSEGDYARAREAFAAREDVPEAHAGLAAVAETEGRLDEAHRVLANAALRWPDDEALRIRRARLAGNLPR